MSETIEIPAGLARQLAKALAAHGRGGDTMLAHINPREARMLKRSGGRGKPNPKTGLLEFDGGGDGYTPGDPNANISNSPQQDVVAAATAYGQAQADQRAATPFNLDSSYIQQLDQQFGNNPNKVQDVINNATTNFYNDPSGFTQTPGGYVPTAGESSNLTDYTTQHYTGGRSFLQDVMKGLGPTGIGPILPIASVAALASGLGAFGYLGAGAADAASLAGANGLVDLTSQVGDVGALSGSGVAQLGDAGFTAGLTAANPGFAAGFGDLGGVASSAAGAAPGLTGLSAPQSTAGAPSLAAPQGTPITDLTSQLGVSPSQTFATTASDATPGAAGGFADASTTGSVLLPENVGAGLPAGIASPGSIGSVPGAALAGPTASGASLDSGGGGGWLSSLLGSNGAAGGGVAGSGISAGDLIKGLGVATSVGGLAKNLTTPNSIPGQSNLTNLASSLGASGAALTGNTGAVQQQANTLAGQGNQLSSYLTSGTLPPGVQTAIDNASADAIAAIKGNYASKGLTGSTMETQDINGVKSRATAEGASIAQNLLSSGLTAEQAAAQISQSLVNTGTAQTGLSAQIYQQLLGLNVNQNAATSQAIANLAAALAGGGQYVGTNRSSALSVNGP